MTAFDRLHPALQHHVVNSLGWRSLRALQEEAIEPILGGEHTILLAPTAGGKTEAAIFPLLSRMLGEGWNGLSIVYLCPIKALLNNLAPRLRGYGELLGRRVALWHGDVTDARRQKINDDPPDILLTTPESLEVMLVSKRRDRNALFSNLRAVVVDEMHAFAGDDRGWHLLAVLERVAHHAGRDLQRVGLSATVGNPSELLTWLAGSSPGERRVVAPKAAPGPDPEITLDYVGSLGNAARVLSRLHRGEKRLVFCDSRARVEKLAAALRELDVRTFVSHSSLSLDERRQAEAAFSEARNCVIVATSTLELGIDVGDLDRVIQIDAPGTVASFLQRLGRTGRRPGSARSCLFLATRESGFLAAAGLLQLWSEGYVEPVLPPPLPYHLLAQQVMALSLQESGIGRSQIHEWIGLLPVFAEMPAADIDAILDFMVEHGILFDDAGTLSIGEAGERLYGRRHFADLYSVFSSPPLFTVLHGRNELGHVHESSFLAKPGDKPVIALGGRSWKGTHLDWSRRRAWVEPAQGSGRSRWLGKSPPLSFELCRAVRNVLARGTVPVTLTKRAQAQLEEACAEVPWISEDHTTVVLTHDRVLWHTFAGQAANSALADLVESIADPDRTPDNFAVPLNPNLRDDDVRQVLDALPPAELPVLTVPDDARDSLKFVACLPKAIADRCLRARFFDPARVTQVGGEGVSMTSVRK